MALASIRGDKSNVRILSNGQAVAWFEITNFDFQEQTQIHKSYFVGNSKPETDKDHMGWSGNIVGEVKNDALDRLIEESNRADRAGVNTPDITIFYNERYPDGSIKTWLFSGCRLQMSRNQAGVNSKTQKSITFEAEDRESVA